MEEEEENPHPPPHQKKEKKTNMHTSRENKIEKEKKRKMEKLLGNYFHGYIRTTSKGYDVHGGFCFWDRNEGGSSFLDFAKAFELATNLCFPEHFLWKGDGV